MRLFGKISHILKFSRNVSCRATSYQPNSLLYGRLQKWQNGPELILTRFFSQKSSNIFALNAGTNMLRKRISFSGTPGIVKNDNENILPVGIISSSDGSNDKGLKILVIPLNMTGSDEQMLRNTLQSLHIISKHAEQIEAFSDLVGGNNDVLAQPDVENVAVTDDLTKSDDASDFAFPPELSTQDELSFWDSYNQQSMTDVNAVSKVENKAFSNQEAMAGTSVCNTSVNNPVTNALKPVGLEWSQTQQETTSQSYVIPQIPQNIPPFTEPTKPKPLEQDPEIPIQIIGESKPVKHLETDEIQEIYTSVPEGLEERLNQMAISSMQLAFEMDMTNIRDAIMRDSIERENLSLMKKSDKGSEDPTVSVSTSVEVDAGASPEHTVPLTFNALIKGTVEIDASKISAESLDDMKIPEFNDNVTAIAANICSTALQRGFPTEMNTKTFTSEDLKENQDIFTFKKPNETKADIAPMQIEASNMGADFPIGRVSVDRRNQALQKSKAIKRMKMDHDSKKRTVCTASVPNPNESIKEAAYEQREYEMRDGCKNPPLKKRRKCPKQCPLADPCKEQERCPPRKKCDSKTKKSKSQTQTQQITASKGDGCKKEEKKKDPCGKKGGKDKKKDPCAKFKKGGKDGKDKKKDPCAKFKKDKKEKKDPCAKDKKKDPCAKDKDKKKDPCAKFKKDKKEKKDPCAKDKKKDPCAKDKKKDPCAKDKKKKDPCAKFKKDKKEKKDPCAKDKKKDPCAKDKKKKDPCAKFKKDKKEKKDPCAKDKKKDPCAKDKDKKKDPCAKFKKDKKEKKDPCAKDKKKDPCAKDKKKDPCAKFKKDKKEKKDPCAKDKKKDPCAKDKKKKDPCAKFKKEKKDPCAKDKKKDPCAKDKKKDPCAKDKKKKDPCAKFKKDKKEKKDPCGKDKKKKDPCAKFKKDKKEKKDPCGKDKDKKKDPCAKFKKDGKGDKKCYSTAASLRTAHSDMGLDSKLLSKSDNKNPIKKSFSTMALEHVFTDALASRKEHHVNYNLLPKYHTHSLYIRRSYGLKRPRIVFRNIFQTNNPIEKVSDEKVSPKAMPTTFHTYSLYTRRHYASKKKDKKKGSGKCAAFAPKFPKNRKPDKKARTGLRTDCFSNDDSCGKKACGKKCKPLKKPRKKCEKKENKQANILPTSSSTFWSTEGHTLPIPYNSQGLRHWLSDLADHRRYQSSYCCPQPEVKRCENVNHQTEQIKIPDSYKIQRVFQKMPKEKDYDVLIRTGSIAITGSDIHVYENGTKHCEGMTLGHDATGFVEKVGSCITHLRVGDRVVMESALSCGICNFCKRGLYNMCAQLVYNGFFGTHQIHPADLCHRLPNSISMEEGALTQTLALGCQACFKAKILPTSNLLIIGSCPTAVAAALCAHAIGAKNIVIASTMQDTLECIKSDFGFEYVHFDANALFGEVLEGIYAKFKEWPNSVINCAISAMSMNLAVMALQPCGICVLAECESECASFNALDILMKNIRLVPSFRSTNMFPTALQLMKSGRAPMKRFISRTFSWNCLEDAFKCAQHESNMGTKKVIVNCSENFNFEREPRRQPLRPRKKD